MAEISSLDEMMCPSGSILIERFAIMKCSISVLSNTVAPSHTWLLSTGNVTSTTEELNLHRLYF